ncbi:MAG: hypothetical protein ACTSVV_08720 [Promethearchaeota archaeon]
MVENKYLENLDVKIGDRIRVEYIHSDPAFGTVIQQGDEGTVKDIEKISFIDIIQIWVQFDKGPYLALLHGIDVFEVL